MAERKEIERPQEKKRSRIRRVSGERRWDAVVLFPEDNAAVYFKGDDIVEVAGEDSPELREEAGDSLQWFRAKSQSQVAANLERIVSALRRIMETGGRQNFAICIADEAKNYHVLFGGSRGLPAVRAEAVSNAYLEPPFRFNEDQAAQLVALGWIAPEPGRRENFYRHWEAKDDRQRRLIAEAVFRTLKVYGWEEDAPLEVLLRLGGNGGTERRCNCETGTERG